MYTYTHTFSQVAELEAEIVQYRKQRQKMSKLCQEYENQMKSLDNERKKLHDQVADRQQELQEWAQVVSRET